MLFRNRGAPVKINVKKLDATIAKLTELRRLATDPALSDFIEVTGVKPSSNGSSALADANGHGPLKGSVLEACKTLGQKQFTVKEVYGAMQVLETTESGTEKSVANMLRLLASEGDLKIAIRGQGRRPTAYTNT